MKKALSLLIAAMVFGCSTVEHAPVSQQGRPDPRDGELNFPAGYDTYPTFLKAVQKPGHVRELFVNSTGAKTRKGETFPNGSILVMEIYNAKKDDSGNVIKRPDGKHVKDDLVMVYVMEKGVGWGKNAPEGLENGDWIFTAFTPDGKPLEVDYSTCRGCHLPLKDKDFVHHYDVYFENRGQLYH